MHAATWPSRGGESAPTHPTIFIPTKSGSRHLNVLTLKPLALELLAALRLQPWLCVAMAASAPPADPASVDADQLARLPLAVVIANELKTGATRVEANGELMVLKAQMPGAPAPVVFLLCQDWSYPLVGAPVLADAGRFILATDKGITFVVEPQQATELEVAAFSAVLSDLCEVHARADPPPAPATSSTAVAPIETEEEEAAPAASWGDKVAGGVAFAGGVAAFGLVKGAKLAGHGIGR